MGITTVITNSNSSNNVSNVSNVNNASKKATVIIARETRGENARVRCWEARLMSLHADFCH